MQLQQKAGIEKLVLFKASEGNEASAVRVVPEVSVPGKGSGVRALPCTGAAAESLWSAAQGGLYFSAKYSNLSRGRFPTLHPNKMKPALTLQNVDEFFRVNQPCQSDGELSPTCDII